MRIVNVGQRLVELRAGADDPDDIARVAASLAGLGLTAERTATGVRTYDPGTEVTVTVEIADRITQEDTPPPYNTPGHIARPDTRAPGVLRENRVQPRKLGHVVLGSTTRYGPPRTWEGMRSLYNWGPRPRRRSWRPRTWPADDRHARREPMTGTDRDVLVIGYGPVGQMLTIMLAQRGYRARVAERWAQAYPRPRAVQYG